MPPGNETLCFDMVIGFMLHIQVSQEQIMEMGNQAAHVLRFRLPPPSSHAVVRTRPFLSYSC